MAQTTTRLVAKTPEETSTLFEKAVNNKDLEGLLTLFEPNAASSSSPTEFIRGIDAIRGSLEGLLGMTKTIRLSPTRVVSVDEVAEVVGDWTIDGANPDGTALSLSGRYVDIVRRQPDGRWLFLIDNSHL
jgi:ketosteroid isomerase-like protein